MKQPAGITTSSYVLLFLPPLFWSTNFIIGKGLADKVPPWTLNAGRFGVSALILLPLLLYTGGWRKIRKELWTPLLLMSVTGVFAFNSLLYTGLHYTTAINATLVNSTTPLTTACLAWLLIQEKMTRRRILGILLSISGIVWIISRGSLKNLYSLSVNQGDLIVLVATTFWSYYSVMAKRIMRDLSPFLLTAVTTGLGTLLLVPTSLIEIRWQPAHLIQLEVILGMVYLGVFPSLAAFLIWNRSVLIFGPGRAALVYNTMPFFAVILSVIFLGEALFAYQIVGGLVAIGGVLLGTIEIRPSQ